MKAEYRTIFGMCLLLLLGLATIAGACPPGGCPNCWHWDEVQKKCVMNGNCDDNSDCCCGCGSCVNCNCASCTLPCCQGICDACYDGGCSCNCSQPYISCFYDDCRVCVGQNYRFSVTGPHENCVNYCLDWSAPGGDPETQYGGYYFTTHWDTPGMKTVYVNTTCSYDSRTVFVTCYNCCWQLNALDPVTTDDCSCDAGNCSGIGTSIQLHTCVRCSSAGYTDCTSVGGQHIGYYWECTEYPDYLGIIECWLLNAGVCALQCAAALDACLELPGSWECENAATSCNACLFDEGIDCGCLVVICDYPEEATDKIYGSDQRLSGKPCCP